MNKKSTKKSNRIKIPSNKGNPMKPTKVIVRPNFKIELKRKLQFDSQGNKNPTGNKYVVLETPTRKLILFDSELSIIDQKLVLIHKEIIYNNETNPIVQKISNDNGQYLSIQKHIDGYALNFEIEDLELLIEAIQKILDWWKQD